MHNVVFKLSEYLKELGCLVNIDSVSYDSEGTSQVANLMKDKFSGLGWQTKLVPMAEGCGPCLEIINEDHDMFDILILAHMDTVFPLGTAARTPFYIKDGRAYGPGVIDCKGGMLSGFYVLKGLEEAGKLKGKSICVFLNSDHEGISSKYSKDHIEKLAMKSKYVLVLEAGRANGNLVNKRKGIGRYHITVHGVAAHAGVDHKNGCSAIEELAHWIIALQGRTDYEKETTLNIGQVDGGTSISAVPDEAKAALDIRFYDKTEALDIELMMKKMIANPQVNGTRAEFSGGVTRPAMVPDDRTMVLCHEIDQIGKRLKIDFGWTASGGGSDGSFTAAVGIPTIDGLGPVGGGAHSSSEYLDIDTVVPRCQLLSCIIEHILHKEKEETSC